MSEKKVKKVTSEELTRFNSFIQKRRNILSSIGTAEVQLKTLKSSKENLFDELNKLEVIENGFTQELVSKYGNVSIDVNTGEISSN